MVVEPAGGLGSFGGGSARLDVDGAGVRPDGLGEAVAGVAVQAGGYPAVVGNGQVGGQGPALGAGGVGLRCNDGAVEDYLRAVYGVVRMPRGARGERASGRSVHLLAWLLVGHSESEGGPVGDEGLASLEGSEPVLVVEGAARVGVDPVRGADEPIGAGRGGELDARVEHPVVDVVLGVHPLGIEEVEGVELSESRGDGGLHALSVVAPDDDAALPVSVVAGVGQGRVVGVEGVHEEAAADGVHDVADVQEHDVAVADAVRTQGVVAVFLAALDVVVGRGELVQEAGGVLVAGVLKLPALEDADGRHPQVLDARVEGEAVVGALLLLVVVDVGVAGVPSLLSEGVPTLHLQLDGDGALERRVDGDFGRNVLGAALGDDFHFAATDIEVERAVGVEERRSRADFEQGIARVREIPVGADDLYSSFNRLAGRLVDDPSRQPSHGALLSCLV